MAIAVDEMYVPPTGRAFLGNPDQGYNREANVTYIRDFSLGTLGINAGTTLNGIYPEVPADHVIWMPFRASEVNTVVLSERYVYDTENIVLGLVIGPELQEVDPSVDEDLTIWMPYEGLHDPDLIAEYRLANNDLVVYPLSKEVVSFGQDVKLTPQQFKLLCFLAVNYGKSVSIEELASEIWGPDHIGADFLNLKHVVFRVRQRTGNPRGVIQNQQGFGYRLKEPESDQ